MMLRPCLILAIACFAFQFPSSDKAFAQQPDQKAAAADQANDRDNGSSSNRKPDEEKSAGKKSDDKNAKGEPKADAKSAEKDKPVAKDTSAENAKKASEKKREHQLRPAPAGAWTSAPTEGDAAKDFALVGEYLGSLRQTNGEGKKAGSQRLGLQLRCLGNGEFRALAFTGGLPGQKKFREASKQEFLGRRHGDSLVLSGGPWALLVNPERCLVVGENGDTLGTLDRIRRSSPTLGVAPPKDALVLFSGENTDAFAVGSMTEQGLLARGADINYMLHDFDLHVEFRVPYMPTHQGQGRGNSGIYLQSRYECQILDSFANERVYNGLGALYRFKPPRINMAFPPLTWQTYDIRFTAARFGTDGTKLRPARVSVWVNGRQVHDDVALEGPTGNGKDEGPVLLPTKLQDHRDPVVFRNVWAIDRGLQSAGKFPLKAD